MRLVTPIGRLYWNKGLTVHKEASGKFASNSNKFTYNATIAVNSKTPEGEKFFAEFFKDYAAQQLRMNIQEDNANDEGVERPCFQKGSGEFADYYLITGTNVNKVAPTNQMVIIDRQSKPCSPKIFYRGCNVIAQIEMFPWRVGKKEGIGCNLLTLQFAGDNEEIRYKGDILPPVTSGDAFADNLLKEFA